MYTRDAVISALQDMLPELVAASINACNILNKKAVEDVEVIAGALSSFFMSIPRVLGEMIPCRHRSSAVA